MQPKATFQNRAYNGFLKIDQYSLQYPGNDTVLSREVMQRGQAACVLVYDPRADTVLLVEEFRIGNHAAGFTGENARSMGPVAGMIEPGQSPLDTAIREAIEEANVTLAANTPIFGPLSTFVSPGGTSEIIHHFVALADLSNVQDGDTFGLPEEGEHTTVRVVKRATLSLLHTLAGAQVPPNGLMITCLAYLEALRNQKRLVDVMPS